MVQFQFIAIQGKIGLRRTNRVNVFSRLLVALLGLNPCVLALFSSQHPLEQLQCTEIALSQRVFRTSMVQISHKRGH